MQEQKLNNWEIIVVDDGSTDNTKEEVEKIINVQNNVSLKMHKLNMGYGKALQTGIKNVKFEWIFITDSDLQFFIYDLDKFIPLTNSYNFIQGIRTRRSDPFHRVILGKIYKSIVKFFFKFQFLTLNVHLDCLKKNLINNSNIICKGPMVPVELLLEAKNNNANFYEIDVRHQNRKLGDTNALSVKSLLSTAKDFFNLLSK